MDFPLSYSVKERNSNRVSAREKFCFNTAIKDGNINLYAEAAHRARLYSLNWFGKRYVSEYEYVSPIPRAIILSQQALNESSYLDCSLTALGESRQISSDIFDFDWYNNINEPNKYQIINLFKGRVI